MSLQVRLSLLISGLILSVSVSIGTFAVSHSYSEQLTFNDSKITEVLKQLRNSSDDPLSLASYLAGQSESPFSLSLITEDRKSVVVTDNSGEISKTPTDLELKRATSRPIDLDLFRIRAFPLKGNEYLLIGYSLVDIRDIRHQNQINLGIFTLIVLIIAIGLSFLIFRRDAEINRAAHVLQENQRRMLEFLGDAAHELRTPLTVIRGYFDLLKKTNANEEKREIYEKYVDQEVARMQRLIDDLLISAELDSKEIREDAATDVAAALNNQIRQLSQLQPKRPISATIPPEAWAKIDQEDLERLLANIFSNVMRYTPEDSRLAVRCELSRSSLSFEIADSGPGLPNEFFESGVRAFQRFDKSRSRDAGGSGLGMSIIQKVVDRWGGKIHLSPNKDGGLRIRIDLAIGQK